jgi:hypothetical protein
MTQFENQTLKGITIGNVKSLVVSTGVICSVVFATYYKLVNKVDSIAQTSEANNRMIELRLNFLEQKISAFEIQLNQIKVK